MDDVYDLVVIGAGPAGQASAELAATFGRRALIVECNQPGGAVTTTGGAPTKALREAALYLTGFGQEEVYGIRAAAPLECVMPIISKRSACARRLARRRSPAAHGSGRRLRPGHRQAQREPRRANYRARRGKP